MSATLESPPSGGLGRHLLGIDGMSRSDLEEILDLTDTFAEIGRRPIPKVPALRGRTVATAFFENSTRTRMSFETAARRLSADTVAFSAGSSSLSKGESLRDTVEVVASYGADLLVVRHAMAGTAHRVADWTELSVVNAGDGCHEHPTNILAFTALGAEVVLVAPATLLPPAIEGWPVTVLHELDPLLVDLDAVYLLRIQRERITEGLIPSLREYANDFGLSADRVARMRSDALVLHPGPTNRGVEISAEAAADPRSVILDQVVNGVSVRMAVLFRLLGSGQQLVAADAEPVGDDARPEGADR